MFIQCLFAAPRVSLLLLDVQDLGGSTWKGRGPQLADVLRLYLTHKHDASVGIILQLAQEYLPMVGLPPVGAVLSGPHAVLECVEGSRGGELRYQAATQPRLGLPPSHSAQRCMWRVAGRMHAHLARSAEWAARILCLQVGHQMTTEASRRSVDPFPSLSGYTVSVWFRVCCEQLQVRPPRRAPATPSDVPSAGWCGAACLLAAASRLEGSGGVLIVNQPAIVLPVCLCRAPAGPVGGGGARCGCR